MFLNNLNNSHICVCVSKLSAFSGDNHKQQQPNDNRHGPRNGQRNKHKQWRWHEHGHLNQYEHEHQREEFQPRTAIRKSALRDSSSERESEKESESASTGGTEVRVNPVRYSCFIFDFAQNIVACSAINLFSKICISSKNQLKGDSYWMGGPSWSSWPSFYFISLNPLLLKK